MKRIRVILFSIFKILSCRNFILIYDIEEFKTENNESGRKLNIARRTDYSNESDVLTVKAAFLTLNKNMGNLF